MAEASSNLGALIRQMAQATELQQRRCAGLAGAHFVGPSTKRGSCRALTGYKERTYMSGEFPLPSQLRSLERTWLEPTSRFGQFGLSLVAK